MKFPAAYDDVISAAAGVFLPDWDWVWLKAQGMAESDLDPTVTAKDGGMGMFQFMPTTWPRVAKMAKLPVEATPYDPKYAALAAACYMGMLARGWWMTPRTQTDVRRLAWASYNAGMGRLNQAQKLAGGALDYASIIAKLPDVTHANAAITIAYVERIERYYAEMKAT